MSTTEVERENKVCYDVYDYTGELVASYSSKTDALIVYKNLKEDYGVSKIVKRDVEIITITEEEVIKE